MMVIEARSAHVEFRLDSLCVLITIVITLTVCLSEKLGKIHVVKFRLISNVLKIYSN